MPIAHIDNQEIFYAARMLDRRPLLLLIHGAGGIGQVNLGDFPPNGENPSL